MGYRLDWQLVPLQGDGRREATVVALPASCSLGHALLEATQVIERETVRLHTLTLVEVYVNGVPYTERTLLRYERDGL